MAEGTMGPLRRLDAILRRWTTAAISELRRTRRVIVPPDARRTCEDPIFVIGVHRSGTTLLRLVLDSHSRIACPPESFFIASLQELIRDKKSMEGLLAMGFDEDHVLRRLRETVSYFFEMYAAVHDKPRWADKTPSYINCLEFIDRLFGPRCRYILIFRHGLDVACSIGGIGIRDVNPYVAACGGDRLAGAARYWAVQCEKMLAFRDRVGDRCHELRYDELTLNPESTLRRMFEFLGAPWEPEVLAFHEKSHDHWIGLQDGKAAESRGFVPRTGTWLAQPAAVIERMRRETAPMLERLGYSTE